MRLVPCNISSFATGISAKNKLFVLRKWNFQSTKLTCCLHTLKCTYFKCIFWWDLTNLQTGINTTTSNMQIFLKPLNNVPMYPFLESLPTSSSGQLLICFLLVWIRFFFSKMSYKQNHRIYVLLCWASFLQHSITEIQPDLCVIKSLFLFITE